MHSQSFILITVWLALTGAFPSHATRPFGIPIQKTSKLTRDGIVDLDATRSHIAHSERKYLTGLAAIESHTGVSSSLSGGTLTRRDVVDADPLTDDGNERWYGTISVGSPAVEYTVDFDTGSSDLFLPGSNCDSTCDGHRLYNPNASSSAVDLDSRFRTSYGDGSTVSGELYTDTISIGGFVAYNQTLGAASSYSTGFQFPNCASDGLLGMGFPQLSFYKANPVIETLIVEGQLPDPIFAFKLDSSGSELSIGSVNTSQYTGPFTFTPVTQQGFWTINLDSMNINEQAVNTNQPAIVDTGTTLILGDVKIVDQFYSSITNAKNVGGGFYTMPCNAMPDVSITIEGEVFAISAETFNFGLYDTTGTSCIGAIAGTGSLNDTWIIGDAFLRNVYSVFDMGQLRVGFAHLP